MFKKRSVFSFTGLCLTFVLIVAALAGCAGQQEKTGADSSSGQTRTLVDQAGRTVTIPARINKAFSTNPMGMIMIYSLDPGKLAGWNYVLSPEAKKMILPEYQNLPVLGGWYANYTCNTEELLKLHPDVIVGSNGMNDAAVADRIQQQLGIPVVIIDTELTKLDRAYEFMGDLLGNKSHAAELAAYCRQTLQEVTEKAKEIPPEKRVRVYYAEGQKGLETDPKGSQHTQVLDFVGGLNIAEVPMKGGAGLSSVSLEQVLAWNPDVILTASMSAMGGTEGGIYKNITTDPNWQSISAVKNHRVYEIPDRPFNWFDRPPSVNRIIGVRWLANLLYPEIFKFDLESDVKDFYARFYHYNLSDQEVKALLANSGGKS